MQVPIYIQGLVMGPLKLDHRGQTQVICKATGNRAKLNVSNQGTLSKMWKGNVHQVSGCTAAFQAFPAAHLLRTDFHARGRA